MSPIARSPGQTALVLIRHIVGLGFVMLATPAVVLQTSDAASTWLSYWLALILFAAAITGLVSLFLTKSQGKWWVKNFTIIAWVFLLLTLYGQWAPLYKKPAAVASPAAPSPPVVLDKWQALPATPPSAEVTNIDVEVPRLKEFKEHYRRIYAAHPDADSIVESESFKTWISMAPTYQKYLTQGSALEIIGMLDSYKQAKKMTAPTRPAIQ